MRFLTCEPNTAPGYICESDQFFQDPQNWLTKHFDHPTTVITYNKFPQVDCLMSYCFNIYKGAFYKSCFFLCV